jgi:hypothetical protein
MSHGNTGSKNAKKDTVKRSGLSFRCYEHERRRWDDAQERYGFRDSTEFVITALNRFCSDLDNCDSLPTNGVDK